MFLWLIDLFILTITANQYHEYLSAPIAGSSCISQDAKVKVCPMCPLSKSMIDEMKYEVVS